MRAYTKIGYPAQFTNMGTDCKSQRIYKIFLCIVSYSYPVIYTADLDVTVHRLSAFHTITVLCYSSNGNRVLEHVD
jgi:hypothetical protein